MRATPVDSTTEIGPLLHALPCVILGRRSDYSDYSLSSTSNSSGGSSSSSSSSSHDSKYRRNAMRWGASPGMAGQIPMQATGAVPGQVPGQSVMPDPNTETLVKTLYNNLMKYDKVGDVNVFKKLLEERKATVNLLHERDLAQAIMSGNMEQVFPLLLSKLSSSGSSDQTTNTLMAYLAFSLASRSGVPNAMPASNGMLGSNGILPQNAQIMAAQPGTGQRMGAPGLMLVPMVQSGQVQPGSTAAAPLQAVQSAGAMGGLNKMGLLGTLTQKSAEQRYIEEGEKNVRDAQAKVDALEKNKIGGI
eukprot:Protomagalhaensia_wolfi_Nauph_80__4793@NODE_49_length_4188_cov_38_845264_g40_i0_p3_GENE_NODE_49_length_4188_cov_38_845264_g40_i0NODE_49_length_4188_cov_38_845264_g40_i0_p3_ORF_typecomplete_len304_score53_70SUZ/PF12752_7/1_2SUZ/PF12752_7/1_2e04SUZ/PF12752_7/5_2e03_NODE_49_length_4188_cov_38_845264_g40_i032104121